MVAAVATAQPAPTPSPVLLGSAGHGHPTPRPELGKWMSLEDGALRPTQRQAMVPACVVVGAVLDPSGVHQPPPGLVLLCLHHPALPSFHGKHWRTSCVLVGLSSTFCDVCQVVLQNYILPMDPSKEFHLSYAEKELLERDPRGQPHQKVLRRAARDLPIYTRTMTGAIRYCDRCQLIKPDHCHHCSVCDKCILKMDHHCPWVNNCVGISDYKFFLLFMACSLMYCILMAATDLQYFVKFWISGLPNTQAKFHMRFQFFAAASFLSAHLLCLAITVG